MTRAGLAVLLASTIGVIGVAPAGKLPGDRCQSTLRQPRLRRELLDRAKSDQAVRQKLIAFARKHGLAFGSQELIDRGKRIIEEIAEIDAANRRRLKEIVDKSGWPGRSLVGKDGAHSAFLLVQHASGDLALQERCLCLMQMADQGEVAAADLALLTDRLRLAKGKKQLYGSQVELRDGRWQVRGEVEEPDKLNDRRGTIGLPPIEEYLRSVEKLYGTGSKKGHELKGIASPSRE